MADQALNNGVKAEFKERRRGQPAQHLQTVRRAGLPTMLNELRHVDLEARFPAAAAIALVAPQAAHAVVQRVSLVLTVCSRCDPADGFQAPTIWIGA